MCAGGKKGLLKCANQGKVELPNKYLIDDDWTDNNS